MTIPKTIHYCWFGRNPLPDLALKCIQSWEKFFPDYKIIQWNEDNYDVNSNNFIREAYRHKKYAFVSDYARLDILYRYGGIYFDTDVEVIKPMDKIIGAGPFLGCENIYYKGMSPLDLGVNPGLGIAAYPEQVFLKKILDIYNNISFNPNNLVTIVTYVTNLLCQNGLQSSDKIQISLGMNIYPKEYFCPLDYESGELKITDKTYTIHHYSASWHGPKENIYKILCKCFGHDNMKYIIKQIRKFTNNK